MEGGGGTIRPDGRARPLDGALRPGPAAFVQRLRVRCRHHVAGGHRRRARPGCQPRTGQPLPGRPADRLRRVRGLVHPHRLHLAAAPPCLRAVASRRRSGGVRQLRAPGGRGAAAVPGTGELGSSGSAPAPHVRRARRPGRRLAAGVHRRSQSSRRTVRPGGAAARSGSWPGGPSSWRARSARQAGWRWSPRRCGRWDGRC